jgi:hypothetical protein
VGNINFIRRIQFKFTEILFRYYSFSFKYNLLDVSIRNGGIQIVSMVNSISFLFCLGLGSAYMGVDFCKKLCGVSIVRR